MLLKPVMYITASNTKGPQEGSFVNQWYKKHAHSLHFYTNARVLMPVVTFYDVKPQSVKIPSIGKTLKASDFVA